jgi:hypothetical protein
MRPLAFFVSSVWEGGLIITEEMYTGEQFQRIHRSFTSDLYDDAWVGDSPCGCACACVAGWWRHPVWFCVCTCWLGDDVILCGGVAACLAGWWRHMRCRRHRHRYRHHVFVWPLVWLGDDVICGCVASVTLGEDVVTWDSSCGCKAACLPDITHAGIPSPFRSQKWIQLLMGCVRCCYPLPKLESVEKLQ